MTEQRMEDHIRSDKRADASVPWLAAPMVRTLERLQEGQLTLLFPNGARRVFTGQRSGPVGSMRLLHPARLQLRIALRGALGLAEGFMAGDWEADNLSAVLQVLAANQAHFHRTPDGRRFARITDRLLHLLRSNSLRGSRRNIAYHYDLGNAFYRLWLDETMTYSSAVFERPDETLAEAQSRKYQHMLDRLGATPGQHILEIGCGWGGFAEHAARQGYRVTGITLSREQLAFARERMQRAGLADRVELKLLDYRHLREQYDHIVSIEMFEAVGEAYWPTYFETLQRCLKPGGRASLQIITIDQDRFDSYRRNADFIQRYIFPGGMLPSVEIFNAQGEAVGLRQTSRDFYGIDYADTLRRWDRRFVARADEIAAQGYDARFMRMWRFYLAYCEVGFRIGRIDLMQVALEKPAH